MTTQTPAEREAAALQSLVSAAELYLNTLDALARPAVAAYLQSSVTILVEALNVAVPVSAPEAVEVNTPSE